MNANPSILSESGTKIPNTIFDVDEDTRNFMLKSQVVLSAHTAAGKTMSEKERKITIAHNYAAHALAKNFGANWELKVAQQFSVEHAQNMMLSLGKILMRNDSKDIELVSQAFQRWSGEKNLHHLVGFLDIDKTPAQRHEFYNRSFWNKVKDLNVNLLLKPGALIGASKAACMATLALAPVFPTQIPALAGAFALATISPILYKCFESYNKLHGLPTALADVENMPLGTHQKKFMASISNLKSLSHATANSYSDSALLKEMEKKSLEEVSNYIESFSLATRKVLLKQDVLSLREFVDTYCKMELKYPFNPNDPATVYKDVKGYQEFCEKKTLDVMMHNPQFKSNSNGQLQVLTNLLIGTVVEATPLPFESEGLEHLAEAIKPAVDEGMVAGAESGFEHSNEEKTRSLEKLLVMRQNANSQHSKTSSKKP